MAVIKEKTTQYFKCFFEKKFCCCHYFSAILVEEFIKKENNVSSHVKILFLVCFCVRVGGNNDIEIENIKTADEIVMFCNGAS